ncbi:MAG: hypothetical protein V4487_01100 [Chlamydiota bacterium]
MTKIRLFIILSILILSFGIFILLKKPLAPQEFVKLPVKFFPFTDQPTIKIDIENKKYSLLIDLGSSHPIDLQKESIRKIKNKKALEISNYIGIRGKYPTQAFQLPEVKLLNLAIDGLVGFEENPNFLNDAKTCQSFSLWSRFKDHLKLLTTDGRMGWTFFKEGTVLFDFPHSILVVAKDINSLINQAGYSLEKFTRIPFEVQKWGLVLSIETDLGLQTFLLDTGATCSIIRASLFTENQKINNYLYNTNKLRIGNNDFGHWVFQLFEYTDRMECDGILGVDFFKKHTICLDFHDQIAYIKNRKI